MPRAIGRNGWARFRKPGCAAGRSCSINSWMDCRPCGETCDPSFWPRAGNGRLSKARVFSRRAVDSAVRADSKETAALWQVNAALREAELGDTASEKQGVTAALALSPGRDVRVVAALALARMGDAPRATALVGE